MIKLTTLLLLLFLISVTCYAEEKSNTLSDLKNLSIPVEGKHCKFFNPETDIVVEIDAKGNCVLYQRGLSPYVNFVYDADGELYARSYGYELQ